MQGKFGAPEAAPGLSYTPPNTARMPSDGIAFMAKHLRFNSLNPIQAPGLDGHKYELRFDVGELINGTFKPLETYQMPVTVSGTLQAIWQQSNTQVAATSASAAAHIITNAASSGGLGDLKEVHLTTYTAPREPPQPLRVGPDTLIPIPEAPTVPCVGSRRSSAQSKSAHGSGASRHIKAGRLDQRDQACLASAAPTANRTRGVFAGHGDTVITVCGKGGAGQASRR
jgi:hypothetical protein